MRSVTDLGSKKGCNKCMAKCKDFVNFPLLIFTYMCKSNSCLLVNPYTKGKNRCEDMRNKREGWRLSKSFTSALAPAPAVAWAPNERKANDKFGFTQLTDKEEEEEDFAKECALRKGSLERKRLAIFWIRVCMF